MLPGVELARRRRVHHGHEIQLVRDPHDLTAIRRRPFIWVESEMEESTVMARKRLGEKLHRCSIAPALTSPSSATSDRSPLCNFLISKTRRERYLNSDGAINPNILEAGGGGGGGDRRMKNGVKRIGSTKSRMLG